MPTKKTIDTLVKDIQEQIVKGGGWEKVQESFLKDMNDIMSSRLGPAEAREPTLRMSNIGNPCARRLWYYINDKGSLVPTEDASLKMKFLYGDILEALLIHLAIMAGHKVEGRQDEMLVAGLKGHRDCVIDGVLIDVKSASSRSFDKFKYNNLKSDDPFGYIRQLSGYLKASENDPLVTEKKKAGFLVIDKTLGHICLDMYDLSKEVEEMETYINLRKLAVNSSLLPPRGFEDEPYQKSGNRKVATACGYCPYVKECWPESRTFLYSYGPVTLTKVVLEPTVREVK